MAANLLLYPLEVISTNRILKSPLIQEAPLVQINLIPQIMDLFKRGGFRDLFRGFIPQIAAHYIKLLPFITTLRQDVARLTVLQNSIFTGLLTLIANPLEILSVRYQNVALSRTHLATDLMEMWSREGSSLFTLGYFHAYFRNMIIMTTLLNHKELELDFPFAVFMACLISHPLEVTRVRQMWSGLNEETASKAVGANPAYAIYKVFQEEGWKALYAGFIPRNIVVGMLGVVVFSIHAKKFYQE